MSALSIKNLHKTYDNGQVALNNVSFAVEQGDFFALLGPNGAGKSTTIGIICSLVNKSSGQVAIFGHDIDTDAVAAKLHLGVVPQEFNFSIFEKVGQIVINQGGYFGLPRKLAKQRAEYYLKGIGLWERRNDITKSLSGGMKRRLMIARALVHQPKLLILDEPTASVDIENRRSMWDFLRKINQDGTTIILTTHYLEEAEQLCKNIAIIDHGQIVEHSSMKSLLEKLKLQSFILDLVNPITFVPKLANFQLTVIDDVTLEVELSSKQNLNQVFAQLEQQDIKVRSMRNKASRLEAIFLHMTEASTMDSQQ